MTSPIVVRSVQFLWFAAVIGGLALVAYAVHGLALLVRGWRGRRAVRRGGLVDLVGVALPAERLAVRAEPRVFDWADDFEWKEGA